MTEGQAATIEGQGQASNKGIHQITRYTVTTDRAGEEVPMCFVCLTLLSNEAMKALKLLRHMETLHVFLNAEPIEYMQQMLRDFHMTKVLDKLSDRISRACCKSNEVSFALSNYFFTLAYLKNKYRARLAPENDMRLSLSTISPRIDRLCGLHHAQISH